MLSNKEKKKLRADANPLKPEIIVGKEGVTSGVIRTLLNGFNTKELVKIKLLETCPESVNSAAGKLTSETEAEIVQIIGRTIILFRELKEE